MATGLGGAGWALAALPASSGAGAQTPSTTPTTSSAGSTSTSAPGSTSSTAPSTSTSSTSASGSSTPGAPAAANQPGGLSHQNTSPSSRGSTHPVGESQPPQTRVYRNGRLVAYGDPNSVFYQAPPNSYIPAGQALFEQYCSSCHGSQGEGSQVAPNLQGLGPATINFWITTGRMPAKNPRAVQAPEKPPQLNNRQALEVAAYVNSLAPATPFIPRVNTSKADLAEGANLFSINCAACHTITGAGDALAKSTFAPSLHTDGQPTATQTAEAIRTGPANMPRFNGGNLTDQQVADITRYVVEKIQHPSNPGGFGLGGIGPVTEGFVGLLFGVGGLMVVCYWIGDRTDREEQEHPHGGGPAHGETS